VQCSATLWAEQFSVVQCSAVQCSAVQCSCMASKELHNTIQRKAAGDRAEGSGQPLGAKHTVVATE
jgi:hypothetical protein